MSVKVKVVFHQYLQINGAIFHIATDRKAFPNHSTHSKACFLEILYITVTYD
jgi:hypothetical protein